MAAIGLARTEGLTKRCNGPESALEVPGDRAGPFVRFYGDLTAVAGPLGQVCALVRRNEVLIVGLVVHGLSRLRGSDRATPDRVRLAPSPGLGRHSGGPLCYIDEIEHVSMHSTCLPCLGVSIRPSRPASS